MSIKITTIYSQIADLERKLCWTRESPVGEVIVASWDANKNLRLHDSSWAKVLNPVEAISLAQWILSMVDLGEHDETSNS